MQLNFQQAKLDEQRRLSEIERKLADTCLEENERGALLVEREELKKQEQQFRSKEHKLAQKECVDPWNVDTISHDGFSKSVSCAPLRDRRRRFWPLRCAGFQRINKVEPRKEETTSEEEKEMQMVRKILKTKFSVV